VAVDALATNSPPLKDPKLAKIPILAEDVNVNERLRRSL